MTHYSEDLLKKIRGKVDSKKGGMDDEEGPVEE